MMSGDAPPSSYAPGPGQVFHQYQPPHALHQPQYPPYVPQQTSAPPTQFVAHPPPQQQQQQQHEQHAYQRSPPLPSPVNPSGTPSEQTLQHEIIATRSDDWTASLVKMAKSAELKKHTLTLQLQTTRIVSLDTNLKKKDKALADIRKNRERLEAQRAALLNQLREVNEKREEVDMEESKAQRDYDNMKREISEVKNGEYAVAKDQVDKLRRELGMDEAKSIESQLEEKSSSKRRASTAGVAPLASELPPAAPGPTSSQQQQAPSSPVKRGPGRPPKHAVPEALAEGPPPAKRPRGRPKGSKNKPKEEKAPEPSQSQVDAV